MRITKDFTAKQNLVFRNLIDNCQLFDECNKNLLSKIVLLRNTIQNAHVGKTTLQFGSNQSEKQRFHSSFFLMFIEIHKLEKKLGEHASKIIKIITKRNAKAILNRAEGKRFADIVSNTANVIQNAIIEVFGAFEKLKKD